MGMRAANCVLGVVILEVVEHRVNRSPAERDGVLVRQEVALQLLPRVNEVAEIPDRVHEALRVELDQQNCRSRTVRAGPTNCAT